MRGIVALCAALACASPVRPETHRRPAPPASPTRPSKPTPAAHGTKPSSDPRSVDRSCAADFDRGDLAAARRRCSDLRPANDPVAVYWRLRLTDDPNELRKGLCASGLKGANPDARLLLLAGRYQFSRGEARELSDLVALADRLKVRGREIDTLRRLATRGSAGRE